MIGISLGLGSQRVSDGGAAPPSFDADAQAYFDRVSTAGGTLSTTEKNAVNQLVIDLKANSLWTPMKAIYPMVGASAAACAQNLKSSSFTGTFSSGWTFASTGVTGNGTSAYMNTGFAPSGNLTNNSVNITFYSRTNSQEDTYAMGFNGNSSYGLTAMNISRTNFVGYSNMNSYFPYLQVTTTTTSLGFFQFSRTTNTRAVAFQNNSSIGTLSNTTNADITLLNVPLFIGGRNSNGTPNGFSSYECAFASIGDGLTDTQASNFYTAVQAFNQTLNRQVGAQIVSDADAQAYINRVYTAGGTLTNTEANAVNQLTIDMKAAGIWTSMKAVYPMVGASAAACAQNLKSSSFTGTFTSGWTFASTGVTPNGTSAYMNTGLNDNTELTLNSSHLSIYSRSVLVTTTAGNIGAYDSGTVFSGITPRYSDSKYYGGLHSLEATLTNLITYGMFIMSRTASNVLKSFLNNTTLISSTTASTSKPNRNIYIGAINGPVLDYGKLENAFASIGDGLTDAQASNFYIAVQAFQTTLSRQV